MRQTGAARGDDMRLPRLSRRSFLTTSGAALAGLGGGLAPSPARPQDGTPPPEVRNQREGMRYRVLGRTNLLVSVLGQGGEGMRAEVLSAALDRGVNLLHVAEAYGHCFAEVARVLPDRRGELFLGVKSVAAADQFADWLNTLRTDHADIVFHPTEEPDEARDTNGAIRERYAALRKAGLVRFLGLTIHSRVAEVGQAALEVDHWDIIMLNFGPDLRDQGGPVLDGAAERHVGTLGMKALAGTKGAATRTAFQTALEKPSLASVVKALPDFELLDMLAQAAQEVPTAEARAELWQQVVAQRPFTCRMCSACRACPRGIAVEESLRCLLYYDAQHGDQEHARQVYASLPRERTVAACAACGTCERVCPNGLPVRDLLHQAEARYG